MYATLKIEDEIEFQFLIGRLAIVYPGKEYEIFQQFQFLIGRLAISIIFLLFPKLNLFQFLIGRLAIGK